jgi:hypothetical protein
LLEQADPKPSGGERFGHFEADVAATDDDRRPCVALLD